MIAMMFFLFHPFGWCVVAVGPVVADKCDALRVAAHERLGEVLRILRIILEHYSALQSTELLVAAGSLIHQVKGKLSLIPLTIIIIISPFDFNHF
jgi:hypothetical protein